MDSHPDGRYKHAASLKKKNYFYRTAPIITHAEASHRRLQNLLTTAYPTLWKFIDGMKKNQKALDLEHEQMVAGYEPPSKKKNI